MTAGADRPLRVLALALYPDEAPSTRFRVTQMVPALSELGVEVVLHAFLSSEAWAGARAAGGLTGKVRAVARGFAQLHSRLDDVDRYDVVMVQRSLAPFGNRTLLRELRRRGVALVYDFDDAVYLPQERGRPWLELIRAPRRTTEAFCRASAVVVAGNDHLSAFAARALGPGGGADRVRVVPSVVDTNRFRPPDRPERTAGLPTLGWVGSGTTVGYLEALAPALRTLAERLPHRLVVVAGAEPPRLQGLEFEHLRWSAAEEVRLVQGLDVGLYPLTENRWTLGKCGFKAVEYLACGVPCVASPVGVLRNIVSEGQTGLLATTEQDWVEACARLLGDPEERARMGRAGRALVEGAYSVRVAAPSLAEALRSAASRAGKGAVRSA